MSNKTLSIFWAILYGICVAMSFFPTPTGSQYGALVALSIFFFLPGAVLLYRAVKKGDRKILSRIRLLSIFSLALTMVMVSINFLSFEASEAAGMAVYILLAVVSAPMLCGQIWVISLFLWACLLMVSWSNLRKLQPNKKKEGR